MGPRFLIDTNAVISYFQDTLPPASADWLEAALSEPIYAISVITRLELFASPKTDEEERRLMEDFVQSSLVLPLDEAVIQQTIALRRQYRRKLPDAIIAATALAHGLTLVTRNVSDFKTTGLVVVDPHEVMQLPGFSSESGEDSGETR